MERQCICENVVNTLAVLERRNLRRDGRQSMEGGCQTQSVVACER